MAEGRVRWGVLSAAKIAREWVVPGIHMSDRGELAVRAAVLELPRVSHAGLWPRGHGRSDGWHSRLDHAVGLVWRGLGDAG